MQTRDVVEGLHNVRDGWKQFPVLSKTYILMGHHSHSISVDTKLMVALNLLRRSRIKIFRRENGFAHFDRRDAG